MVPDLAMLQAVFDVYDAYPLECDGMTRVIHAKLAELGIAHTMRFGSVDNRIARTAFAPHMYIELATEQGEAIIDYRARQVLGEQGATAHGVFLRADQPHMLYAGAVVEEAPLSAEVIALMLMPIPEAIRSKLAVMNRAKP
jgi:hypothetical protein